MKQNPNEINHNLFTLLSKLLKIKDTNEERNSKEELDQLQD